MALINNLPLDELLEIATRRLQLSVLLEQHDCEQLVEVMARNLAYDYIKSLFHEQPDEIDFEFVQDSVNEKLRDNQTIVARIRDDLAANEGVIEFPRLYYLIRLDGAIIGTCLLYSNWDGSSEFGLFIDREHARHGYGTESIQALIELLRTHSPAVRNIYWTSLRDNAASIAVARKCGFTHCYDYYQDDDGDDSDNGQMLSVFELLLPLPPPPGPRE
jgi:RimJ/RimL family protein N-acetyltransferase